MSLFLIDKKIRTFEIFAESGFFAHFELGQQSSMKMGNQYYLSLLGCSSNMKKIRLLSFESLQKNGRVSDGSKKSLDRQT